MNKSAFCSGVLLLNKPTGISSNRALQICKRLLSAAKAGHTGTLDPMAQGLLPICLGEATKFSSALLHADKTYIATLKLGYISNTGDAEGEIIRVADPDLGLPDDQKIIAVLQTFLGRSTQIPPMYSALKRHGKPLYRYAREGVTVERPPREIMIYQLSLDSLTNLEMVLTVRCSSGTYIRTLAEDIGKALGFGGAYLTGLSRTSVGHFDLAQSCTLDQLEAASPAARSQFLSPVDSLLPDLPAVILNNEEAIHLRQGRFVVRKNTIEHDNLPLNSRLKLYNETGEFLGLGELLDLVTIVPKRMVVE